MTKRRDVFIYVAEPGKAEQAQDYLGEFLRSLDGHPGYLGGSVLKECAGELLHATPHLESVVVHLHPVVDGNRPDDLHELSGHHASAEARAAYRAKQAAGQ